MILSTWIGANTGAICVGPCAYARLSGTSMAAAHVTGVAALLVAQSPALPVAGIKSLLLENVTPLANWAGVVASGGRLNAYMPANAVAANGAPSVQHHQSGGGGAVHVHHERSRSMPSRKTTSP